MADQPKKMGAKPEADSAAEDADESERPTLNPPFDPVAFARDVLGPGPASTSKPAVPQHAADAHTHATPPQGVAQAPRKNVDDASALRRKTPTSTLSLANARVPSDLPPRPRPDAPEWASLDVATRPPPADGSSEDPLAQDKPPRLDRGGIASFAGFGEDDEHDVDTVRRQVPAELVAELPPESHSPATVKPREREMSDRVELGDYSGALEIAEKILADNPKDLSARTCAETCRSVLRQMYATRIGPLDRVPVVMVPRDQLRWLSIDHKAGFVLSHVDGVSTLEMIIDVSGMLELDTLRILSELAQQRIISLR